MTNIFISYRRADSQAMTDRIYDHMAAVFGKAHVFQDVFDIDYGEDFRKVIEKQVNTCDIMLVVIGVQWLTIAEKDGTRRLDNPQDSVRIEVESGLHNARTRVIPVLVNGATIPPVDQLPETLRDLGFRNGVEIRHNPYFDEDARRLAARLKPRSPLLTPLIAAGMVGLLVLIAAVGIPRLIESRNGEANISATGTAVAATIAANASSSAAATDLPSPQAVIALSAFSLYQSADDNSLIVQRVTAGTQITVTYTADPAWVQVSLEDGTSGWVRMDVIRAGTPTPRPGGTPIAMTDGHGARSDVGWQVFFTQPLQPDDSVSSDCSSPNGLAVVGIPARLADAIDRTQHSLDIATYRFNQCLITQAVLDAYNRGVTVRVVTDDEAGIEDEDTTLTTLVSAGIPVISDARTALMHNTFMILDGVAVWTGSWDFTYNDAFRNQNNTLVFTDPVMVAAYQTEFDELFVNQLFGPISPPSVPAAGASNGILLQTLFGPEDNIEGTMLDLINGAQQSIDFMMFSFTLESIGQALSDRASAGIQVRGIFERVGSETDASQLRPLWCAGIDVRQDANAYIMHHKVIIIDRSIVMTGSFNLNSSAMLSNDENLVILRDPNLAAEYLAEFEREWSPTTVLTQLTCS